MRVLLAFFFLLVTVARGQELLEFNLDDGDDSRVNALVATQRGPRPRLPHPHGPGPLNNVTVLGTLVCRDSNDMHRLLYRVCNHSTLCRELYYMEGDSRDFRKFVHQLSLLSLFDEAGAVNSSRTLFMRHLWPSHLMPYYLVRYNAAATTPACADTLDRVSGAGDLESLLFVYAAMHMMMSYKQFVSNDFYCNDHNERLLLDPVDGTIHCECRHDKVCNNDEAAWSSLWTMLLIMILAVFLVLAIFIPWGTMRFIKHQSL